MKRPTLYKGKRWEPLASRFARMHRANEAGCWLWVGVKNKQGYGHFEWSRKGRDFFWMAHRAAWRIHRGPIPGGLQVLHRCDVPSCVNPDHLFLGTQQDNMDDMVRKGRARRHLGSRPFPVSEADRAAAIASAEPVTHIAKRLGVTRSTVHRWRQQARQG